MKAAIHQSRSSVPTNQDFYFWERVLSHTFISHDEKQLPLFNISMELIYLLDANSSKLIWSRKHSACTITKPLNTKLLALLYWNKNTRVTTEIFPTLHHGIPLITEHSAKNNKAILVLGSVPSHPKTIKDVAPIIEIVLLLPKTIAIPQSMD